MQHRVRVLKLDGKPRQRPWMAACDGCYWTTRRDALDEINSAAATHRQIGNDPPVFASVG